jgi:SAM-dependent methyltransferase
LTCQHCELIYPVRNGIASLVYTTENTLPDRRFARFYDWLSLAYGPLTKLGFLPFGGDRKARMEILDRLELGGGQVLEVSVGTGSNLPYLFESQDVGDVFGLDISPGQLECCRRFVKKRGWVVNLFHGTAEALPFKAESFDSVFHIGGINFFSEKKRAIEEMIRVARPGSRIVIADESERAARALSRIPGFARGPGGNRLDTSVPVHLVPDAMEEVEIRGIWKAHGRYHGYCLEFRKPNRS